MATIKVADALAREIDIHYELRQLPKIGAAVILDDEKKELPTEHENLSNLIKIWEPHTK